jgi:hypothetical protein
MGTPFFPLNQEISNDHEAGTRDYRRLDASARLERRRAGLCAIRGPGPSLPQQARLEVNVMPTGVALEQFNIDLPRQSTSPCSITIISM